ncbi:hypothetical protein D9619_005987 [Psilocybe cf. subviscida]|uniref:RlpA-like protein double-psi beta-barrel domain-containing protein n=1 Tax=Psilocybe cf. subviscida TaxID=2480587 RepID=A0A8H5BVS2_9AGAR|nr:hypothetical protein D9619_005987 [Psilocybe cf. subviscida]
MFTNLLNLSVLALLPLTAFASHGNPMLNRHHQDLARRQPGHVEVFERAPNSKWSFYNVETGNAGSCGQKHTNNQFTVALNAAQMNPSLCFKTVRMTYNGKTTTATISDTCPGCPYNGMDLTEGLFLFFAPASVGIIYGDWEFADAAPAPPPKPAPKPPAPKPSPKPTSTWVPPPPPKTTPTTTWTPEPTTTKSKTSSKPTPTEDPTTSSKPSSSATPSSSAQPTSSAPSSSINFSSGAASGLAVPTSSINVPQGQSNNIANMNNFFVQMGGVIAAGSRV